MPCSIKAWYDVTPEAGNCLSRGHVNRLSNSNIRVYENTNEMLGSAIRFSFRGARLSRMWRLLQRLHPGYGPYYGGYGGGPYYNRPYYGGYPGSVTVEVGDRPYYRHGAGYYVGRTYYVWKPGHWASRNGQRVWIHGHYVVRGGY